MSHDYAERRNYNRVPLDMPYFVLLRVLDEGEHAMQLRDCSRGGLQLAFPPGEKIHRDLLNKAVTVLHLPLAMDPESAGLTGFVVWLRQDRCGVRFDDILTLSDEGLLRLSTSL
jgi:c-di-GMP-binding flagellar brake protein YcgR